MIDLHSDIREIERYAKQYEHYIPFTNARTQHRMLYDYIAHPLVEDPQEAASTKWYDTPDQVKPLDICRDRAIGALVGLAVGDAVGTTLEFMPRDHRTVTDMVGGGPFRLKPGEWTDDTSMALCLAETVLERKYASRQCFRDKLVKWYREGYNSVNGVCFDIGNATRYALEQYEINGADWFGNTSPETAGNASIIRLAPVPIYFRRNFAQAFYNAKIQSQATHCATEAVSSAHYLSCLLLLLINGYDKERVFSPQMMPLEPRVLIINAGEYKEKSRDQIRSSGYVIDTLEAAMWAVWHTDNFRDAILLAANLADDADSVAATAGQLAGALYGWSGIPQAWKEKLVQYDRIVSMAAALFDQAPDEDTPTE
ncbi:ADP-ribosylarginine hydrolase Tri1 [Citrobacter sp. BDA59-3]|uniref:ADP-ribosylarginine hydrolase Tri1 n=1 Tax=Citrobacter sp. BDA59-3 TaxID=2781952 RepID=UPI001881C55B|nr:ADP-ribosylarginine hydrolase Tri1 [Citrobacter sp. BDA59-3]QOV70669.1 ADP-ribosylglycohydrolase family protein [Citrobacter sp. BDA59-3]